MSVELPRDKCKQIRPRYGRQSFLQVETKPEDDLTIPFIVRCPTFLCNIVPQMLQSKHMPVLLKTCSASRTPHNRNLTCRCVVPLHPYCQMTIPQEFAYAWRGL